LLYCELKHQEALQHLFCNYQLAVEWIDDGAKIPGSFWGDSEAGLIGNILYVREDTPIHSAFHEACHYICMDKQRRQQLHTDAAGDYDEENGVCYLQIILAHQLAFASTEHMMADMDKWGYTFRLGSTKAWFEEDAEDARAWLLNHDLLDQNNQPTFNLRIN